MIDAKFPDVVVQLTGGDGNVYCVIGKVSSALRRAGYREEAEEFASTAMNSSSYDEVLRLCMAWVEVT